MPFGRSGSVVSRPAKPGSNPGDKAVRQNALFLRPKPASWIRFGAVLFFFLVILAGNMNDKHGSNELGWFYLALCEIVSIFVSLFIHPVCITTCFLFSIPVVIYIKWASTKIKNLNKIQKPANAKKNK